MRSIGIKLMRFSLQFHFRLTPHPKNVLSRIDVLTSYGLKYTSH
jgi:hypothetical protein